MIAFPNAKINIGLNIVSRRDDGMHNLVSVFYPIALHDILEIVPSSTGHNTLHCYGNTLDCDAGDNLVMRAIEAMQSHCPTLPRVEAHLYKHIPSGAGLGGGSSDAAAAMVMLNEMCDEPLSKQELAEMAVALGADCPFFIYNTPMLATGIGNIFTPAHMSLKGLTLYLVKPPVHVSTKEAYSQVTPMPEAFPLAEAVEEPPVKWHDKVKNDFEPSVFAIHPTLLQIKQAIMAGGATYAAMSGSGSAIYGIFESATLAEKLKGKFKDCADFVIELQ